MVVGKSSVPLPFCIAIIGSRPVIFAQPSEPMFFLMAVPSSSIPYAYANSSLQLAMVWRIGRQRKDMRPKRPGSHLPDCEAARS